MGWNLSDLLGPGIVVCHMTSSWRPGTSNVHQGFLLCPVSLNIFVPDLSDGTLSCTQEVCSWYKTQRSGWYSRGFCCCSETGHHAGEKRRRKICEVKWRQNAKFCTWVGITSCASYMLGPAGWKATLQGRIWSSWWMAAVCSHGRKDTTTSWASEGNDFFILCITSEAMSGQRCTVLLYFIVHILWLKRWHLHCLKKFRY